MAPWAKRLWSMIESGESDGLSMGGLIKATKAKQSSVWQWFKAPPGKKTTEKVRAEYLVRAAKYVGTSVEYLVTGKDAASSQSARLDEGKLAYMLVSLDDALKNMNRVMEPGAKARAVARMYFQENVDTPAEATIAALMSIMSTMEEK